MSEIKVSELKCNWLENPPGPDNAPNFSWINSSDSDGKKQTSYQLILDPDIKALKADDEVIWNSGKTSSSRSSWIIYGGKKLEPGKKYYWRVRVWDENDKPSQWSKPAFFITGLFDKADWNGAKWIGYEDIPDSLLLVPGVHGNGNNLGNIAKKRTVIPYFRKEFSSNKRVKQALLFVSG